MNKTLISGAAAFAVVLPCLAAAQQAEKTASAPQPQAYRSAFADYKPFQEITPGDWRARNDTVGAAAAQGGHGASHAAPAASATQATTPSPATPASAPAHKPTDRVPTDMPPGHEHHHSQGGKR